jgi:hypothetical protein
MIRLGQRALASFPKATVTNGNPVSSGVARKLWTVGQAACAG